jgi:hypothetical protein
MPGTLHELIAAGGPEALSCRAAATAAATVASREREFWLGFLEGVDQDGLALQDRALCSLYIRDLRRKLGIGQSKEMIREQTRLRVRRLRERRRAQRRDSTASAGPESSTTATEPVT